MESAHKDFTLAPRASSRVSWLETLLLSALAIGLGFWLSPEDPLMVEAAFPWVIMAPLLLGMRYGFMNGLASAAMLVLALFLCRAYGEALYQDMPASFIVGVLISGMLVGEFRDIWERRLERLDLANDYRQLRLDEFTRAHYILRISHDRLEQRVAGTDQSLRSSLLGLRSQLRALPRGDDALVALAGSILSLLAMYGSFRVAGLYRVSAQGRIDAEALSSIGEVSALRHDDLLVRLCLKRGELVSVREALLERGEHRQHSLYQACIPLVDTEGRVLAILAVEQMPFFAFNERTLSLLMILAGHIADLLLSDPLALQLPDSDAQAFSQNLKRSLIDAEQHSLEAYLYAFELEPAAHHDELLRLIEGSQRGLDLQLKLTNQRGNTCVLVLLPLTSAEGAEGYLLRLNSLLRERFGLDQGLGSLGVTTHAYDLDARNERQALRHFLFNECAFSDQQVAI
ncbi:GAF domain-containing protein [Pseudomonas sp. LPB0260]|uniref:PelD GGDEF domain-containing protein n=1 Tax=Pseudomonas sp. LPB0260 TaxID=2614442 RepID=UPI0015C2BA2B|nr:PelD GGDEF domain-containing protein [Pseudomonas sp. LPB0260]QLC77477.1 GAF domain-containing protein [Pseudomonas sp. LPB0260]QLC77607.1 GAF domain-containing protein [Pseudomonas sp. LPB0260]